MKLITNVFVTTMILSCGVSKNQSQTNEKSGNLIKDSRSGLHGMVLFGNQTKYLAHIPMFMAPHNLQLVMSIKSIESKDGEPILQNFTKTEENSVKYTPFSIKPTKQLSLDNLALGMTKTITTDIYYGNFEKPNSKKVYSNAKITIDSVIISRNLPENDLPLENAKMTSYYFIGNKKESYLINKISKQQPFQHIIFQGNISTQPFSVSKNNALIINISRDEKSRKTNVQSFSRSVFSVPNPGGKVIKSAFTLGDSLWCLKAPDFFNDCDNQ